LRTLTRLVIVAVTLALALGAIIPVRAAGGDTLVTVGSPPSPFTQNKQNEPALAVDADHPNVLVAGANDEIDFEACNAGDPTTCPFTAGVGVSGVYFSFDSGTTWTQPTYSGWSARDCLGPDPCAPHVGPIGTLPHYYENGLVSGGDPAVAFGPVPDASGHFSWTNGSRLYYANLVSNFTSGHTGQQAFPGAEGVAVSRTDNAAAAAAGDASAWMDPVIVSKQNAALFSDKEQVWADNAASSPFFGHAYVCSAAFRSNSHGQASPIPLVVATSTDGGSSWTTKQVTPAVSNFQHQRADGCSVRTDSHGVVYVFANQGAIGLPGYGTHLLIKSYDGGATWTKATTLFTAVDTCIEVDFVQGRCVEDGVAGARDDLGPAPSVDIANGAPTGTDATNEIVDSWVDGRDGLNHEHVMVSSSTDGGTSWAGPTSIEQAGDRGFYSAPAISPNGTDVYVVYNAYTTPFRSNTTDPRSLVGVVLHADVGAAGTTGPFTTLHRGAPGDPRASSSNGLTSEFLGDYVYAVATRRYGAGVWNDTRNAADCPAIDAYRQALQDQVTSSGGGPLVGDEDDGSVASPSTVTRPAPNTDCPATFGNSDIYGGSYPDPSP
jgi:hypothetical protein